MITIRSGGIHIPRINGERRRPKRQYGWIAALLMLLITAVLAVWIILASITIASLIQEMREEGSKTQPQNSAQKINI